MYLHVVCSLEWLILAQGKENRTPSGSDEIEWNRKIKNSQIDFLGRPCVSLVATSSGPYEGKWCLFESVDVFFTWNNCS